MDEDLNSTSEYSSEPKSAVPFVLLVLVLVGGLVFYFSGGRLTAPTAQTVPSQTTGSATK